MPSGYFIDVYVQSIPSGTNYNLELYNPSGVLLASSTNSGNADEYVYKWDAPTGEYRIKVFSVSGSSASDSYLVYVSVTSGYAYGYPPPP